jgi:carbonic anhydrase/acetyltransferase-like protein (isoleucine patch superfamily)
MPLFAFEGTAPTVDPSAWIAPTATLVGDVRVEAEASVWYGAVLRADFGPIIIRAGANIQDNSVLHGSEDPLVIGVGATVGHLCVVHNCVIGTEALIGNGAIVQDGARIGDRALVGAGSLVPPGMVIPDEQMALGAPATVRGPLSPGARWWVESNPAIYQELATRHRDSAKEVGEQR